MSDRKPIHPKGAQNLVQAIVAQASDDFRHSRPFSVERQEVERFFRSPYFTTLTYMDGKPILKRLRAEDKQKE